MVKKSTKISIVSALTLGLVTAMNQIAFAVTSMASKCSVNGQEVPCDQVADQIKGILGWGVGLMIALFVFGIWATIFWIMMLVHVSKHNVDNKAMWIILMVFTGVLGSIVYYFVVKRKFNEIATASATPTAPSAPTGTPIAH